MIASPKVIALASVASAFIADAALLAILAMQSAPTPSLGDIGAAGAAGGGVTLAILWFWKGTVDKRLDEKADKTTVADMGKSIDRIEANVTWLVRQRQGDVRRQQEDS